MTASKDHGQNGRMADDVGVRKCLLARLQERDGVYTPSTYRSILVLGTPQPRRLWSATGYAAMQVLYPKMDELPPSLKSWRPSFIHALVSIRSCLCLGDVDRPRPTYRHPVMLLLGNPGVLEFGPGARPGASVCGSCGRWPLEWRLETCGGRGQTAKWRKEIRYACAVSQAAHDGLDACPPPQDVPDVVSAPAPTLSMAWDSRFLFVILSGGRRMVASHWPAMSKRASAFRRRSAMAPVQWRKTMPSGTTPSQATRGFAKRPWTHANQPAVLTMAGTPRSRASEAPRARPASMKPKGLEKVSSPTRSYGV